MPNELCHFEIPAKDPAKLTEFYENIFDWNIGRPHEGDEMEYHWVDIKPVGGGVHKKTMPEMVPINYISVDNIDDHVKIIQEAGGMIVKEKTPVPGMGWFAVALDPEQNPFGIWVQDENAK